MPNMLPDMRHTTESDLMMGCQMPEQRDTFTRSASLNYPPQSDMSNSPELFQTPLNQQRQLSGSLSGNKLTLLPIAFQWTTAKEAVVLKYTTACTLQGCWQHSMAMMLTVMVCRSGAVCCKQCKQANSSSKCASRHPGICRSKRYNCCRFWLM